MAEPLVTIGIPMYNAAATVGAALRSCFAQTHPHVEVVVVDNNSTDGSVAAAERAAAEVGRAVRVVGCARQGPGPARDAAWAAARGAFVAWLDADDLLHPDKLRWQLEALRPFGAGPAIASGDVVVARAAPGGGWWPLALMPMLPSADPALEVLQGRRGVPPVGYLLTRAAAERLNETGGFLAARAQDREYFGRAQLLNIPFVHVPRVVGLYRHGSVGQVTNSLNYLLWAPALEAAHRSWRAACDRTGVVLTGAQRAALERSWAYWRWRPARLDGRGRLVVGAAGERALTLTLTGVQRAVVLATRSYPAATVEMMAVATCEAMPSLYPAFGRVLEALNELVVAGAFEALDEAEARRALDEAGA